MNIVTALVGPLAASWVWAVTVVACALAYLTLSPFWNHPKVRRFAVAFGVASLPSLTMLWYQPMACEFWRWVLGLCE